ncbi:MAG: lytic murein transglycosylase B [Nitrosomonadaceae bacterium]|nr:lytic murein transglycosylase B [Nitrosomonadaceae bacterium]|tara:strand:+ start:119 stop:1132 length:1014 start_codon:yes stop_codon:yes gene_type:complete
MCQDRNNILILNNTIILFIVVILLFLYSQPAMAEKTPPEIKDFINKMVKKHGFKEHELKKIFSNIKIKSNIIKTISRPSTSKQWYEYHPTFINKKRIIKGVSFWEQNAETLERAKKEFGVPEEIITALIGVETYYGKQTGRHRVLDALTTLAFNYSKRSNFFRNELEQYLLLTREQGTDIFNTKGSYAGAIGIPQFMPSSYRNYAVDFDNDGRIDLSGSIADSIGSVANYLTAHGWEINGPTITKAQIKKGGHHDSLKMKRMPLYTVKKLKKFGITASTDILDDRKATLIKLNNKTHTEYWLGFNNFYAITRYNHSTYYAMSVLFLSEKIRALRGER